MSHTILVVDDDATVRHVIRRSLEQAGYDVREATNGAEAFRALCAAHFDLVITDILMPDRDGLEVIILMRKQAPGTKVIAISGATDAPFLLSATGLGAAGVLAKPFKPDEMLTLVKDLLGPSPSPAHPSCGARGASGA